MIGLGFTIAARVPRPRAKVSMKYSAGVFRTTWKIEATVIQFESKVKCEQYRGET